MEDSVPKRVFTFLTMESNKEIYEICIDLKSVIQQVKPRIQAM